MRPRDYDGSENTDRWERDYQTWLDEGTALQAEQNRRAGVLAAELATLDALKAGRDRIVDVHKRFDALETELARLRNGVIQFNAVAALLLRQSVEVQQAREAATARLLGDVPHTVPAVLLPVRVETRWDDERLRVLIRPDELHIDSHEGGLTADERTWGEHWWGTEEELRHAAWRQLAERFGARRAAWIVARCDPAGPAAETRDGTWTRPPLAEAMPDRWAVIGLVGDEPVLTAWSRPVLNPLPAGPSPEHGIGNAAGNRWLVDFDAAEAAGMGVSIALGDRLPERSLDALVVLGLRTGLPAAGDTLAGLLDAHHHTRGLGVLAAGTPTNNTASSRSGHTVRRDADELYAIERGPALSADPGNAGARIANLLGIDAAVFAHVEGADQRDDLDTAAMKLALGAAGGALRDRLAAAGGADAVTALWAHVQPNGCVPALRIAAQPYGILPTTAPSRWVPASTDPGGSGALLASAWADWRRLANGDAARRSWVDPLADVLTEHAVSTQFALPGGRALVYPAGTVGAPGPDGRPAEAYLEAIAAAAPEQLAPGGPVQVPPILLARLAVAAKLAAAPAERATLDAMLRHLATLSAERLHALLGAMLDTLSHRGDGWVTALAASRLETLPTAGRVVGAYGVVHLARPRSEAPKTLGYVHAPSLAQAATAAVLRSGYSAQAATGSQADPLAVNLSSDRVRKALWLLDGVRQGQPLGALLGYRFERRLADANLQHYISEFRKLVGFRGTDQLSVLFGTRQDATAARTAAEGEQSRLAAERARLGVLLAVAEEEAQRCERLRANALAAVGPYRQHVSELEPAARAPQAARDALRGHDETRPQTETDELAINAPDGKRHPTKPLPLAAARLRKWAEARVGFAAEVTRSAHAAADAAAIVAGEATAKEAAEEALQGHIAAVAAALAAVTVAADAHDAARDEAQHQAEHSVGPAIATEAAAIATLAAELRRQWAQATTTTAVTSVVDGLELRRRFRAAGPDGPEPSWNVTTIPFPLSSTAPDDLGLALPARDGADFAPVAAVLRDLDDHVDAVTDLLVAEGVHQLVQGNPTRAGGALDALAAGHVPADIDAVRTPRTGIDVTHRVAVVLDRSRAPRWRPARVSFRAKAEPALEAWASQLLPDPAQVVSVATLSADTGGKTVIVQRRDVTLDKLGLGALDLVHLGEPADGAQHGELEQRLGQRVLADWAAAHGPSSPKWVEPTHLRLDLELDPPVSGARVSAAELLSVATALRQLLADARPLSEPDVGAAAAGGADADLESRVAAIRNDVASVGEQLDATLAKGDGVLDALFEAARLGLAEAVPPVLSYPGGVPPGTLDAHARSVLRLLAARLAACDRIELPAPGAARVGADPRTVALLERAGALLGRDLRVLPALRTPVDPIVGGDLKRTPNERLGLTGAAELRRWLHDVATVRPAVSRLMTTFDHAEALGGEERLRLRVTQLPPDAKDRWAGLPAVPGAAVRAGRQSLVIQVPAAGLPEDACGLVVDDWTETVPGATHLTGLGLHYDQLSATPPQAILVVAPPDARPDRFLAAWDLDTLSDTVVETLDLARLRAIAPDRLATSGGSGVRVPAGLIEPSEVPPS